MGENGVAENRYENLPQEKSGVEDENKSEKMLSKSDSGYSENNQHQRATSSTSENIKNNCENLESDEGEGDADKSEMNLSQAFSRFDKKVLKNQPRKYYSESSEDFTSDEFYSDEEEDQNGTHIRGVISDPLSHPIVNSLLMFWPCIAIVSKTIIVM